MSFLLKNAMCPEGTSEISRWRKPPVVRAAVPAPAGAAETGCEIFRRPCRGAFLCSCIFRWFRFAPPPANVWSASGAIIHNRLFDGWRGQPFYWRPFAFIGGFPSSASCGSSRRRFASATMGSGKPADTARESASLPLAPFETFHWLIPR
jgi:hypothetical protein